MVKNFTSSMTECTVVFRSSYVCDDINIFCFSDFVYAPGLSSIDLNQSSKHFKNWFFSHENRRSSVDENGTLNGFNSRDDAVVLLTFSWYEKIYQTLKKNSAAPAAYAGP